MRTTRSLLVRALAGVIAVTGFALAPGGAAPAAATVVVGATPAPSWKVNGRVYAVEVVGRTVFVGGTFTTATSPDGESEPRQNLAAFDVVTGEVLSEWQADTNGSVRALTSRRRWLYVGGAFKQVAGQPRARLAKVRVGTASVNPTFAPRFNRMVRAIAVDARAVYAGGAFTRVGPRDRRHVAKLDAGTGRLDRRFVARTNRPVRALVRNPSSPALYIAGDFTAVNGARRIGVAAIRSGSGRTARTVFRSSVRPTLGLAVNDNGSRLFTAGGSLDNAATAYRTTTGRRAWSRRAMGDIQAVDYHRGSVYFGFHDGYEGDTSLKVLAAHARTGRLDEGFRPSFDLFPGVLAIDVTDDTVVVGGRFTLVSDVDAGGFARFVPPAVE